ncbi:hypothetical protein ACWEO4_43380 [Streptomyces sp. NPDC004393]
MSVGAALGMGTRIAFKTWVEHGGGADDVARFSTAHHITTGQAWTAALILMALTEVVTRTATLFVRSRMVSRTRQAGMTEPVRARTV